jgi:ABC-type nitrate/sulfonate/bicarbonate transport system substrate-binding protein
MYQSSKPYVGFFVPIDSSIKTTKDLGTGTTAVSFIHDLAELAVYKAMDEAGLDYKTSQFVELPMSASAAAVDQKRVTAGEASNPVLQAALGTGKYRFIPAYDEFGKEYIFSVWFVTQDFAKKHADVVKTFARVEAAAARYTNSHPKDTEAMLSAFSGIPQSTIAQMPRVTNGTSVYASGIQNIIDTEAKYGFIPRGFPAAELIDPDVIAKGP